MNEPADNCASPVLEHFLQIERDLGLFDVRVDGVAPWELVRYPLYLKLQGQEIVRNAPQGQSRGYSRRWASRAWMIVESLLWRNPWFAPRGGLVFIGHPRRKLENGHYVDIYTDPVLELLSPSHRYVVLERPMSAGVHLRPAATRNLFYLDAIMELVNLRRKRRRIALPDDLSEICRQIERRIQRATGRHIDVAHMVRDALARWHSQVPVFRELLKRLRPSLLVVVVSSGNETMLAAAKSLGVPTAELQHGSPAAGKLNYDYPRGRRKQTFPDYFLSFGPFWTEHANLPLPPDRIIPFGFPYISAKRKQYLGVRRQDQLIVISQPTVAAHLISFVLRLRGHLGSHVRLAYKVHPSERVSGAAYAELESAGVDVFQSESDDLYEMFASSRWQLGVYSTALYEGLAFSCTTFILDVPGAEFMYPLVSQGVARLVRSPEEVDLEVRFPEASLDRVFAAVSADSAKSTINRLMTQGPDVKDGAER